MKIGFPRRDVVGRPRNDFSRLFKMQLKISLHEYNGSSHRTRVKKQGCLGEAPVCPSLITSLPREGCPPTFSVSEPLLFPLVVRPVLTAPRGILLRCACS